METVTKRFILELHLSYIVDADGADTALRAVLPMAANAESASALHTSIHTRSR